MYFMHLKFERRTLAIIALTPVILCIMLMFMLLPDQHRIFSSTAAVSQPSTTSH
jgi:cytochrome c oxidase subunit IV